MSHSKERKEKDCLNCGAIVEGRYCQNCGQENIEPQQTFGHLASHFVADIFHFDSKFFSTLKYLFGRPGFLSKEYIQGRRQKYLHPIKMFVFTSAVFFFIYFAFVVKKPELSPVKYRDLAVTTVIQSLGDTLRSDTDPATKAQVKNTMEHLRHLFPSSGDSARIEAIISGQHSDEFPATIQEYDSIQKTLPRAKRDNYFERLLKKKNIERQKGGRLSETLYLESFEEHFRKTMPQMLFLSLPLIALFLKLLYIRRKHRFVYVDHVIFLVHVFIAVYLIMLVEFGMDGLYDYTQHRIFKWLALLTLIYAILYPLFAMYRFYGQNFFKTLGKYIILLILAFLEILLLIVVFAFITFILV